VFYLQQRWTIVDQSSIRQQGKAPPWIFLTAQRWSSWPSCLRPTSLRANLARSSPIRDRTSVYLTPQNRPYGAISRP